MVHAMVKSLDAKLTANPDNPDGWLRLIRSYAALDEKSQAAEALRRGLAAFPVRGVQAARLVALGREFGIVMEGTTR
jgi:cytochrome c-type biogenesis protein CcmH